MPLDNNSWKETIVKRNHLDDDWGFIEEDWASAIK